MLFQLLYQFAYYGSSSALEHQCRSQIQRYIPDPLGCEHFEVQRSEEVYECPIQSSTYLQRVQEGTIIVEVTEKLTMKV